MHRVNWRLALLALAAILALAGCGGSGEVANDVGAVVGMIDRAELTAGAANLQLWYQAHGTYAGAASGVSGVTVARAGGNAWCLQTANAHEVGPGGTPAGGAC
ncbi:MAG: hypothetical protein JO363_07865 [Solirubrobacterales bacterium]|nr:hypothetical protein [Solirubrobacterales bacterium]